MLASMHASLVSAVGLGQARIKHNFNGSCPLQGFSKSQRQSRDLDALIPSPASYAEGFLLFTESFHKVNSTIGEVAWVWPHKNQKRLQLGDPWLGYNSCLPWHVCCMCQTVQYPDYSELRQRDTFLFFFISSFIPIL